MGKLGKIRINKTIRSYRDAEGEAIHEEVNTLFVNDNKLFESGTDILLADGLELLGINYEEELSIEKD